MRDKMNMISNGTSIDENYAKDEILMILLFLTVQLR